MHIKLLHFRIWVCLIPAYSPLIRTTKPCTKIIKTWPEGALTQLQDCFENTCWDLFYKEDLEKFTETVLFYIKYCMDNVTVDKCIRIFPNQKPWMTSKVRCLLKKRNIAFRSGDEAQYSTARAGLRRGIKEAKDEYRRKIEVYLEQDNSRSMWQAIQHITKYKHSTNSNVNGDASLCEQLNCFFARFEANMPVLSSSFTTDSGSHVLTLQEHDARRVLRTINPRKATGPDGVPGKVLQTCADQVAGVFTRIFNISLSLAIIPSCLKSAIIIPVLKKQDSTDLNNYRPVALTPIIMKCFEKLVLYHIKASLPPSFDPYQFAYRAKRATGDAIALATHLALPVFQMMQSYVRILFIDFSSAFNTIVPDILMDKLLYLGFHQTICTWINDFLTNRSQHVKLGFHKSTTIKLNIGAPQGCVLSPVLYTLYTHDCSPVHLSNSIIKFADDTTVAGLISNEDESA